MKKRIIAIFTVLFLMVGQVVPMTALSREVRGGEIILEEISPDEASPIVEEETAILPVETPSEDISVSTPVESATNEAVPLMVENLVLEVGETYSYALHEATVGEEGNTLQVFVSSSALEEKLLEIGDIGSYDVILRVVDELGKETLVETQVEVRAVPGPVEVTESKEDIVSETIEIDLPNFLGAAVENDLIVTGDTVLAGINRFETAVKVSMSMYEKADTVVLVSGIDFPDALSAGPLAAKLNAPVLLTQTQVLTPATLAEIKRLEAKQVIVLGGEAAIGPAVIAGLKSAGIATIERIQGANRYLTAVEVAKHLIGDVPATRAVLTNSREFADALSAGSYAAKEGIPILLTMRDTLNVATKDLLVTMKIKDVIVMGGEAAISIAVEQELGKMGITVTRIAGSDRFNTGVAMAQKYFPSAEHAVVTNGFNFPDALAAVPYAAKFNAPILLVKKNLVTEGVMSYIDQSALKHFHFIGGTEAIEEDIRYQIMYPSVYEIGYATKQVGLEWQNPVLSGRTSGVTSGTVGVEKFHMETSGDKDIRVRYAGYVSGKGWQEIMSNGHESGLSGSPLDGILVELYGNDASQYDAVYRVYIKNQGWTSWSMGGQIAGNAGSGNEIMAMEAKVIEREIVLSQDMNLFPAGIPATAYSTSDTLNLRTGPGTSYSILAALPKGTEVGILSTEGTWTKVACEFGGKALTGYVSSSYLMSLGKNSILTLETFQDGDPVPTGRATISGNAAYEGGVQSVRYYINNTLQGYANYGLMSTEAISQGFNAPARIGYWVDIDPSKWKTGTNTLKVEVVGQDGSMKTTSVILKGNTLDTYLFDDHSLSVDYFTALEFKKSSALYNGVSATKEQILFSLDPVNWIFDETYKFMFLDLSYSPSDFTVTAASLNVILNGKGVLHGKGESFLKAAVDFGVNPFYLVAHSLLETGNGTSVLANGQKLSYYHVTPGSIDSPTVLLPEADKDKLWYNVFGIGAYDGNANLWGGELAYKQGWDSVDKAIYEGSEWIGANYINRAGNKQNTLYDMRFNLNEHMTHEYATDLLWAKKQASRIKLQFDNMGVTTSLKFVVPTFNGN